LLDPALSRDHGREEHHDDDQIDAEDGEQRYEHWL
jgi:hypothetical protein